MKAMVHCYGTRQVCESEPTSSSGMWLQTEVLYLGIATLSEGAHHQNNPISFYHDKNNFQEKSIK